MFTTISSYSRSFTKYCTYKGVPSTNKETLGGTQGELHFFLNTNALVDGMKKKTYLVLGNRT